MSGVIGLHGRGLVIAAIISATRHTGVPNGSQGHLILRTPNRAGFSGPEAVTDRPQSAGGGAVVVAWAVGREAASQTALHHGVAVVALVALGQRTHGAPQR